MELMDAGCSAPAQRLSSSLALPHQTGYVSAPTHCSGLRAHGGLGGLGRCHLHLALLHSLSKGQCCPPLQLWIDPCEGSYCLHENNSISALSLDDRELTPQLDAFPQRSAYPPSSFFSAALSGSARWHIMESVTNCEWLYCFPCHRSCIHFKVTTPDMQGFEL